MLYTCKGKAFTLEYPGVQTLGFIFIFAAGVVNYGQPQMKIMLLLVDFGFWSIILIPVRIYFLDFHTKTTNKSLILYPNLQNQSISARSFIHRSFFISLRDIQYI
jgi:hypothetical protein